MNLTFELHSSETHEDKWLRPGSKTLRGISMSLKKEGGCVVVEADTQMCRGLGLARQKRRKIDVK